MADPPRVEPHGGRARHPWLHGAAAVLGAATLVAVLLMALLTVWDIVIGNWLSLPLDVIAGGVALAALVYARRAMRRYR